MKILMVNKFHYQKGGSERYVFSLTELLENKGHTVIPFSMKDKANVPSDYSDYFAEYIDLHKFSIKNIIKFFYNYDALRKLEKLIKREKPDIAHLHNIAHQLTPAIILKLKKYNIPVVQTLHAYKHICPNSNLYNKQGNCEKCLGGKYYNCFLNNCMHDSRAKSFLGMLEAYLNNSFLKAYDKVDMFIAPSNYMKDASIRFGIAKEKISVIYNFLSDNYLKNIVPTNDFDNSNEKYLLYFGRLSSEKGIQTIINSLPLLKDNKINLRIAGSGPYEAELRLLTEKLNLSSRVKFLGYKHDDELMKIIKNVEAIIMPSLWPENMPYSLLESMALEKILLVADVGGMPEMIEDKASGFLFKAGDAYEMAEILNNLQLISQDDKLKMGRSASQRLQKIDMNYHYENMLEVYKSLLPKIPY